MDAHSVFSLKAKVSQLQLHRFRPSGQPPETSQLGSALATVASQLRVQLDPHHLTASANLEPSRFAKAVARWRELNAATKTAEQANDPALDEIDDARYSALCEVETAQPASIVEWLAKLDLMAVQHSGSTFDMVDFLDLACRDLAALGVEYAPSSEAVALERNFKWGPPAQ